MTLRQQIACIDVVVKLGLVAVLVYVGFRIGQQF